MKPRAQQQAQMLLQQAIGLHQAGKPDQAKALYRKLLMAQPRNAEVLRLLGVAEYQLGQLDACVMALSRSLELLPQQPETEYNLAFALDRLGRHADALAHYDRAVALKPDYAEAYYNRANTLKELGRFEAAIASHNQAIAVKPGYAKAYYNRALMQKRLGRYEDALASYDKAIAIDPAYASALHNRGNLLGEMKRLDEAIVCYDRALSVNPDYDFLLGNALHTRMHVADWRDFDAHVNRIVEKLRFGQKATSPLPMMSAIDDPAVQQLSAEIYTAAKHPPGHARPAGAKYSRHDRIRVGYFSTDLGNHPVTHLLAGMFERHDRSRFEVFAFSFGPDRQGPWRDRAVKAFEHFIDVRSRSEQEIAAMARELEIDLAIDLNGYVGDCLPQIFAERAAPVQASYIGYLGTMGAPFMDYLIADPVMVPEGSRRFYSEKIISLHSYQCNDDKQKVPDKPMKRQDFGLPENGFVFCSFNNNYKILPAVFDSWMRILKAASHSVLWLYVANGTAVESLKSEAEKRGVDSRRIIFASEVPYDDHMARQRLADLFLDTHPYNAGATASLALRAGLPILTRLGEAFAARMGASLLTAVGLPEMIARTPEEYEARAIHLATHPVQMTAVREKLAGNLPTCALFDTERFTRNIEAAYVAMYERSQNGLPPDHIDVSRGDGSLPGS
jgi:protein O-GlcNAc transferase